MGTIDKQTPRRRNSIADGHSECTRVKKHGFPVEFPWIYLCVGVNCIYFQWSASDGETNVRDPYTQLLVGKQDTIIFIFSPFSDTVVNWKKKGPSTHVFRAGQPNEFVELFRGFRPLRIHTWAYTLANVYRTITLSAAIFLYGTTFMGFYFHHRTFVAVRCSKWIVNTRISHVICKTIMCIGFKSRRRSTNVMIIIITTRYLLLQRINSVKTNNSAQIYVWFE